MIDYRLIHELEDKYGSVMNANDKDPLLLKLRESAIGNEADPQVKYPNISTNISHDDAVEIRYYWEHGIHGVNKIGRLMGHDHVWVAKRLEVMGLNTIKHKHISNAEQRKMHQKGRAARRNG